MEFQVEMRSDRYLGACTRPIFSLIEALLAGHVGCLGGFSDDRWLRLSREVKECKPLPGGVAGRG